MKFYERFAETICDEIYPKLEGRDKEDIQGTNDDDDDDLENVEDVLMKIFDEDEKTSKKAIEVILSDKKLKQKIIDECARIINEDT